VNFLNNILKTLVNKTHKIKVAACEYHDNLNGRIGVIIQTSEQLSERECLVC